MSCLAFNISLQHIKEQKTYSVSIGMACGKLDHLLYTVEQYLSSSDIALSGNYFEKRRQDFLLGRKALKQAFSLCCVEDTNTLPRVAYGIFGQPLLKDHPGLDISISHSSYFGIAAIYPREILFGIDLEMVHPSTPLSIALEVKERSMFEELKLANQSIDLSIWTTKEALSKALKCGLGVSAQALLIDAVHLEKGFSPQILKVSFKEFYLFNCFTVTANTYALSFALPKFLNLIDLTVLAENIHGFFTSTGEYG